MGIQVTVSANQIDKQRLGYQAISISHLTDLLEPQILAGSKVEIAGALYEFTADESGTGWAGIGASNTVYILLTTAGASVSWSYTTTAPTWDTARQGWYTGTARAVAMLYKDASSNYAAKTLLPAPMNEPILPIVLSAGSPYSLIARSCDTVIVAATTNPYVINLPPARVCIGWRVKIINIQATATGLIRINPATGDSIGQLSATTEIYLQNVDQGGRNPERSQWVELEAVSLTKWSIAGMFIALNGADVAGAHYSLGRYYRLATGNTVNRQLVSAAPPAAGNWSTAITGSSSSVYPGAKAIRVRVEGYAYATAAGAILLRICVSDNNSNVPTVQTAHGMFLIQGVAGGAAALWGNCIEMDVPLNASNQFYVYTLTATNVTVASSLITVSVVGYWMGE